MIAVAKTLLEAFEEADNAIQRVDEHADNRWKAAAEAVVLSRAASEQPFTTDDVMDDLADLPVSTHDGRALGPVMRRAVRSNNIHEVGMTRSRRRHGARIPIYQGGAS